MERIEPALQRRRVQREFERAADYASEYNGPTPLAHFFQTRIGLVAEMASDVDTGRILSVGCGPAEDSRLFTDKKVDYFGIDLAEGMLRYCTHTFRHRSRCHFTLGTVEALSFPEGCFDGVLCLGAFEYFEDSAAAMKELARVVKKDGIVIVSMHNPYSPYRISDRGMNRLRNAGARLGQMLHKRRQADETVPVEHASFRVYSERKLRKLLGAAKLQVERVEYFDQNIFLAPLDSLFPVVAARVSRGLECLSHTILKGLGSAFIIKARKAI